MFHCCSTNSATAPIVDRDQFVENGSSVSLILFIDSKEHPEDYQKRTNSVLCPADRATWRMLSTRLSAIALHQHDVRVIPALVPRR